MGTGKEVLADALPEQIWSPDGYVARVRIDAEGPTTASVEAAFDRTEAVLKQMPRFVGVTQQVIELAEGRIWPWFSGRRILSFDISEQVVGVAGIAER